MQLVIVSVILLIVVVAIVSVVFIVGMRRKRRNVSFDLHAVRLAAFGVHDAVVLRTVGG